MGFAQAKAAAPSLEDLINGLQRKRLGYKTPEELFDEKLDLIYRLCKKIKKLKVFQKKT